MSSTEYQELKNMADRFPTYQNKPIDQIPYLNEKKLSSGEINPPNNKLSIWFKIVLIIIALLALGLLIYTCMLKKKVSLPSSEEAKYEEF